jgi:hypothetical protein
MLEQEQLVADQPLLALGSKLLLQFKRLAVIDAPELPELTATH